MYVWAFGTGTDEGMENGIVEWLRAGAGGKEWLGIALTIACIDMSSVLRRSMVDGIV